MAEGQRRFGTGIILLWLGYGTPLIKGVIDFGVAKIAGGASAPFDQPLHIWRWAIALSSLFVVYEGVLAWLIVKISKRRPWARNLYLALFLPSAIQIQIGWAVAGWHAVARNPVGIFGMVCSAVGLALLFLPQDAGISQDPPPLGSALAVPEQGAGPATESRQSAKVDRLALGFGVAPAFPALVAGACAIIFVVRSHMALVATCEVLFFSSVVAYFAAIILGVPLYFAFERMRWRNLPVYLAVGCLIGVVLSLVFVSLVASVVFGLYGFFSAGCFWLIARPDLRHG